MSYLLDENMTGSVTYRGNFPRRCHILERLYPSILLSGIRSPQGNQFLPLLVFNFQGVLQTTDSY